MTSERPDVDEGRRTDGSLPRRTVLKLAGLVALLGEGTAAGTASETGDRTNPATSDRPSTTGTVGKRASAVALAGRTALVGLPPSPLIGDRTDGRAVILSWSDGVWSHEATLAPAGECGQFGSAVALDGNTAVVGGECGSDPGGAHAGSVVVFERTGEAWVRRGTFSDPTTDRLDLFGTAVAVSDGTVVVGASGALPDEGSGTGSAFIYERSGDTWTRTATLTPPSGHVEAFGRAVAIDGERVVVGAERTVGPGVPNRGVAYVFERTATGWRRDSVTLSPGSRPSDGFGRTLDVRGDTVVTGAPTEPNKQGINAGAVYVFRHRHGTWRRLAPIRAGDAAATLGFGTSVALGTDRLVVGAELGDGPYVYSRSGGTWHRHRSVQCDRPNATRTVSLDGGRALASVDERPDQLDSHTASLQVFAP